MAAVKRGISVFEMALRGGLKLVSSCDALICSASTLV
jgi:ferredoxin